MSRKEKGDEKGKGFRGWDWKQPSWGFSESKPNTIVNGDFSVDLNLGRLESRSGGDQWQDPTKVSMVVSSSPLGTSKKARAPPSNDPQTVSCLVDGCASDLSKCRDYYRRHKICETHSKTPIVLVGGQEQRFCQQCSRLHLVVEFDEAKRSCRKRLDGHNRRRRKSQLEPFPMNVGSLCSNYQGNQYLSFSNPQFYQPAGTDSPRQRGLTTTEDDAMHYGHHLSYQNGGQNQLPRSFSCNFNGGEQHPFPQPDNPGLGNRRIIPEVSFSRPLVNTSGSSSESSGFRRVGLDSDRALSLLSSQSSRPSSSGVSSGNHIAQTNPTRMDQPLVGGGACLQYADLVSRYHQSQRTEDNAHVDQRGIFHTGPDGPMGIAAHPFPFSWE